MGYSHYWYRIETPDGPLPTEPPDAYGHLALDTIAITTAAAQAGIPLAGGDAAPGSHPTIDEGGICLNGGPGASAETFAWPARPGPAAWWTTLPGQRWWDACKTGREPYDAVVCAVLIRAKARYGRSIRIESDGNWDGTTINGRHSPEWTLARHLVIDLFGPAADHNPLIPP